MEFLPILSIFALAASAIGSAAAAQAPAPSAQDFRRYSAIWLIQPKAVPQGPQTIRKGGFVYQQRLLPPTLVRLETAAVDAANGKTLAEAGGELFGLVTAGPPIFCATGREYTQRCFTDMDRDGRLDGHFTKSNPVQALPSISGKRPETLKPLKGGLYRQADPRSMKTKYLVGVRFNRVNSLLQTPNPVFRIVFGSEAWTDNLSKEIMPGAGPQEIEALGARFRVLRFAATRWRSRSIRPFRRSPSRFSRRPATAIIRRDPWISSRSCRSSCWRASSAIMSSGR